MSSSSQETKNSGRSVRKTPTTKIPKGTKTEAVVRRQSDLWPESIPADVVSLGGIEKYTAFWLLLNFTERQVLFELSSPSDIDGGKITAWHERIILPWIDFTLPPKRRSMTQTVDFCQISTFRFIELDRPHVQWGKVGVGAPPARVHQDVPG
jgi:hypothetical protein